MRANGYNFTTVLLHWITVIWVAAMLTLGVIFHELNYTSSTRYVLETVHIVFGIVGIFFLVFRVVRRLRNGFKHYPNHALYERFLSRAVQYIFMQLLVVVPITGLIMVLGYGYSFPGGIVLPSNDAFLAISNVSGRAHDVLTKVLAITILVHVAGAAKHAILDRDGTLMGILKPVKNGR